MVEPRRVELLSEDQTTRASPSAVCVLTFPPRSSRKQDLRISSFIKSHRPQSLRRLVPCLYDADGLRRRRLRVDVRALSSCEFYVIVVVSSFKFPLMRQFRAAARFSTPPYPRRNQIRPHDMDPEKTINIVPSWIVRYRVWRRAWRCHRAYRTVFCPCTGQAPASCALLLSTPEAESGQAPVP